MPLPYIKGPELIDAMRVIGMFMREEHRIERIGAARQHLLAKVGRCIDQHTCFARLALAIEQYGATPAPVFRVGRIAQAPIIADARDTAR